MSRRSYPATPAAKPHQLRDVMPDLQGAACQGSDIDFVGAQVAAARAVCKTCPTPTWVRCFFYSVRQPELEGIWAGLGGDARQKLRRWNTQAKQAAKENATA